MKTLLVTMLREELRNHITYSSLRVFLSLPLLVLTFSLGAGLTLDRLQAELSLQEMLGFAHGSVFLYGISVGSFGFLGRQFLERRYGSQNYVVTLPLLLPFSFRSAFLGLYLRDAIFYVLLVLVPGVGGLLLAAPLMGYHLSSIGWLFAGLLLTFLEGMSLSFFLSAFYFRTRRGFIALTASLSVLFVAVAVLASSELGWLVPGYAFGMAGPPLGLAAEPDAAVALLWGIVLVLGFAALAVISTEVHIELPTVRASAELPRLIERSAFARSLAPIVAKDLLDLRRSGTVGKLLLAFIFPLLFLSATGWFVTQGLQVPVGFNTVFYAAMIGFIGVFMYSWLNNLDLQESLNLLPLRVPDVIRARLVVFFLLTSGISTAFVIGIALVNGEPELLPLALVVMAVTAAYMVVMTAYLTGLRTNSILFDATVLLQFSVLSFLPDTALTILSFGLQGGPGYTAIALLIVLSVLLGATWLFYRGLETKWGRASFAP